MPLGFIVASGSPVILQGSHRIGKLRSMGCMSVCFLERNGEKESEQMRSKPATKSGFPFTVLSDIDKFASGHEITVCPML